MMMILENISYDKLIGSVSDKEEMSNKKIERMSDSRQYEASNWLENFAEIKWHTYYIQMKEKLW